MRDAAEACFDDGHPKGLYDQPKILRHANTSICPLGTDVRQCARERYAVIGVRLTLKRIAVSLPEKITFTVNLNFLDYISLNSAYLMNKTLLNLSICFCFSTYPNLSLAQNESYGRGVDAALRSNYELALREWLPLAQRGEATPQFQVGWLYENGLGVSKNYVVASQWYRRAAEQGYAYAQSALGRLFEFGRGSTQDLKVAYMWYSIAGALWDTDAHNDQGRVIKKMNVSEINLAQKLTITCINKNFKNC